MLELVPGAVLVDLRRDGFDMAVRYGRGNWPGVDATYLTDAGHVAVAAPSLVPAPVDSFADLAGHHWILERDLRRIALGPPPTAWTCRAPASPRWRRRPW